MKKLIITTFIILLTINPVYPTTLYNKVVIPNTKTLSGNLEVSNRLNDKFVITLISNEQIKSILQELARDNDVELQPFQYDSVKGIKFYNVISDIDKQEIKNKFKKTELIDGCYFYVKYKNSKKDDFINVSLAISGYVLDKASPISSVVGGILIPFLRDKVFKVTKFRKLQKFNKSYALINTIMVESLLQVQQQDIKENPEDYDMNKIKIYTKKLIIPKNADVEIYADEIILE